MTGRQKYPVLRSGQLIAGRRSSQIVNRCRGRNFRQIQGENVRSIIFKNDLAPGDDVMLTAAVRDLHICSPRRFRTDVRTPFPELWENNPNLTPLDEGDPDVEVVQCHYPLVHHANQRPYHFLHGYQHFLAERLRTRIEPMYFHGDIHLSEEEMLISTL